MSGLEAKESSACPGMRDAVWTGGKETLVHWRQRHQARQLVDTPKCPQTTHTTLDTKMHTFLVRLSHSFGFKRISVVFPSILFCFVWLSTRLQVFIKVVTPSISPTQPMATVTKCNVLCWQQICSCASILKLLLFFFKRKNRWKLARGSILRQEKRVLLLCLLRQGNSWIPCGQKM